MKKRVCFSVLAMTLLVSLGAVVSGSAHPGARVAAQIPFDFQVGDKEIPAGVYTVDRVNADGSLLRISSRDSRHNVLTTANEASSKGEGAKGSRLIFRKYGDRYFLAAVWDGNDGRTLPESKSERGMKKGLRASLGGGAADPQLVTIAARLED